MKILVTGFDPFNGEKVNPSTEALKHLPEQISGAKIIKLEIPTVFHQSTKVIHEAIKKHQVDVVLSVGQAGGRKDITLERIGINIDDARIPDNIGALPIDETIQTDGAPAYFSNLPVKRIVQAIKEKNIPASLSNSAGTFVCNHVLYQLGYLSDMYYSQLKFGFMHVPYIHEQVENQTAPSMSLNEIVEALITTIEIIVKHDDDVLLIMGTTH